MGWRELADRWHSGFSFPKLPLGYTSGQDSSLFINPLLFTHAEFSAQNLEPSECSEGRIQKYPGKSTAWIYLSSRSTKNKPARITIDLYLRTRCSRGQVKYLACLNPFVCWKQLIDHINVQLPFGLCDHHEEYGMCSRPGIWQRAGSCLHSQVCTHWVSQISDLLELTKLLDMVNHPTVTTTDFLLIDVKKLKETTIVCTNVILTQ